MTANLTSFFQQILDSSVPTRWLAALVAAAVVSSVLAFLLRMIARHLQIAADKTVSVWDNVTVELLRRLSFWALLVWSLYGFAYHLSILDKVKKPFQVILVVSVVIQVVTWGQYILLAWKQNILDQRIKENPSASPALGLIYRVSQVALVVIAVLMGLSNIGVDIGALLAGLGVGGIAVALAAQNILGDLLASLSIVLDKPFSVGDFVITGDVRGTIENIGIKTTRIRSLSGEQIVISNKDLLESRIQNYQRLQERRVVKQIGVIYGTPPAQLQQIPAWIRTIVEETSPGKVRFDRCHFANFGPSSLDFEFVFYVAEPDYALYMTLQEKILLEIVNKFAQEGLEFAFPSQTIYLAK
jgi:small-conductance mechanosensitive channel